MLLGMIQAQTPDSVLTIGVIPAEAAPVIDLALVNREPKVYVPRQALLWSLIPGGGQVYNERWWKVPLVFSAFSGVVAVLDFNQSNYQRFKTAYDLELAGQPHEFTGIIIGADRLRVFRDNFNKSRQTNYFFLGAVYLLQAVEAYVDAQLRNFDIDDDLTQWQLRPQFLPSGPAQPPVVVLQLQYSF
ncbi:MAG: hypothetical protein DA408_04360 [Bacteroidetes bacterium]|nr:MAG: hypothetical protein C7N36_13180 [Bacteroidota bacterium]PTM14131.1 MAG: hypothetical protein DA408_04360 [Bacteroidota bacterium]